MPQIEQDNCQDCGLCRESLTGFEIRFSDGFRPLESGQLRPLLALQVGSAR